MAGGGTTVVLAVTVNAVGVFFGNGACATDRGVGVFCDDGVIFAAGTGAGFTTTTGGVTCVGSPGVRA